MIKIITIGKIKDQNISNLIEDYKNRVSSFTRLEVIEIQAEKIMAENDKAKELITEIEGRKIMKIIEHMQQSPRQPFLIILDENGSLFSSEQLAERIKEKELEQDLVFVIGGALGLSKEIKQKANLTLSFSKMTFAHGMMRLFLIEQIYRAYTINKGMPYHK